MWHLESYFLFFISVGPAAIIGGTISIYSAALSHTSSTLTPLSVLYLFLLALNYSIMPRLSKTHIHPSTNKQSLALVEECVKLFMGLGGFLLFTDRTRIQSTLKEWTWSSSLMAAGLPSALYALQGVLTYTSYQNLDSFAFNGLTQMKTLTAALCCYWVLGKVQSPKQIFALVILSLTPLLLEDKFQDWAMSRNGNWNGNRQRAESDCSAREKVMDKTAWKKRLVWGIVPCLGATLLSGLAGALSQKSLQQQMSSSSSSSSSAVVDGSSSGRRMMLMLDRNPYFYSAEISFFTAVCLLISMIGHGRGGNQSHGKNLKSPTSTATTAGKNRMICFDYWSWKTFVPIVVKAMGGILTAMVHKHSGSVMKGFSLVLGLIFSALLQTVLDGKDLTGGQVMGTVLVLISSWLHFTSPPPVV
jgi:UDP-sugar transporter A1/2/3